AKDLGAAIDAEAATALYLALHTDTGGFRFSNTTEEAFDVAADLVRCGAEPARVAQWLYESQPETALRLLAAVLDTLTLYDDGRVATLRLERATAARVGASPSDSEGLIDYPRSIAGVEAVALFRELPDGRVKASLRSRGRVDVEKIARSQGGGGHKNAAGVTLPDPAPILEVERRVAALLAEALAESDV
ncbi:MAG: DHHA1 domain-containing protein, partial [Acidobacteriota bacterium]